MLPIEPEIKIRAIVISAHADRVLCEELEEHLSSLTRSGEIALWQYREIPIGANWEDQIDIHLNDADLILLLVSSSAISSNYCWNKEMQVALERHKEGTACVIPIILRPVLWQNTPLGRLQALPTGGKAVTRWENRDAAFEDVARGIQGVVKDLRVTLQKEDQRKTKINGLMNELKLDIQPALRMIEKDIEDIECLLREQEEKKKQIETELETINILIESTMNSINIIKDKREQLRERLVEKSEQILTLGADPSQLLGLFVGSEWEDLARAVAAIDAMKRILSQKQNI